MGMSAEENFDVPYGNLSAKNLTLITLLDVLELFSKFKFNEFIIGTLFW